MKSKGKGLSTDSTALHVNWLAPRFAPSLTPLPPSECFTF